MGRALPKPQGEYALGTFTYTVYNDRDEVLEIGQGSKRSIASRVYYPVLKETVIGLKKCTALSENMIKGFKMSFKVAPIIIAR